VYTRLWNRRFHLTVEHHLFCAFAALCTLFFTVLYGSLYFTKDAAIASIDAWQEQLNHDGYWGDQTYAEAYDKVKELGIEDFSRSPAPGNANSLIPTSHDESRQLAASTYADEACRHFDQRRPFLSKVVWSSPGVPSEVIFQDVKSWHEHNPNYPPSRAIEIAATQIKDGLEPQAPRVIFLSRLAVAVLFILIQALPFGLIGWAAYRDIKVRF
jgi:hypothetical protein